MGIKKTKKNTKEINFEKLEEEISVLSYMNNDLERIVKNENESYTNISNLHQSKKEIVADEEEKINIILQELIISCDNKKGYLDKCVHVANNIIHKNEQIIEKERESIQKLIAEKEEEIELIQKKSEHTKTVNDSLNNALTNIFKNLSMFLNTKIAMDVNVNELLSLEIDEIKTSEKEMECSNNEEKKHINENEEEEWKHKLYDSVEQYMEQLQTVKQLIQDHLKETKGNELEEITKRNTRNEEDMKRENKEIYLKEKDEREIGDEETVTNLQTESVSDLKRQDEENKECTKELVDYNDTLSVLQNNLIVNENLKSTKCEGENNENKIDETSDHSSDHSSDQSSNDSSDSSSNDSSDSSSGSSSDSSSNDSGEDDSEDSSDGDSNDDSGEDNNRNDSESKDNDEKKKTLNQKKKKRNDKIDTFIEKIKNMDYDYVSYFQQKLKNS